MWKLRPGALTWHRLDMQCFFFCSNSIISVFSRVLMEISRDVAAHPLFCGVFLYFLSLCPLPPQRKLSHNVSQRRSKKTESPQEKRNGKHTDLRGKDTQHTYIQCLRREHRDDAAVYYALSLSLHNQNTKVSAWLWRLPSKGNPPAARCDPGDAAPLVSSQHTSQACPRLPLKRVLHSWISAASGI